MRTSSAARTRSPRKCRTSPRPADRDLARDFGFKNIRSSWRCAPTSASAPRRCGTRPRPSCATPWSARGMATEEYGWEELPGEGAFYAPKLEWPPDRCDRPHPAGGARSSPDRVLPERLDASYVGEDGERHRPVMLHRAIFGSLRTLHRHPDRGISPASCRNGSRRLRQWSRRSSRTPTTMRKDVAAKLQAAGIRADTDLRNEKINYKVREHFAGQGPQPAGGRKARGRGRHRGAARARRVGPADDDP